METGTSVIEIGVGVACLLVGIGSWRGRRWLGVALAILGAVAIGHGILALVR